MGRTGWDSPTPSRDVQKHLDNTHINTHPVDVRYSFDPAKQTSNRKKRGLDLADAEDVIESGLTVTFEDRRIISMRKTDRHEQAIYRENLS
jgi:uncharacterized DUF497 family protein